MNEIERQILKNQIYIMAETKSSDKESFESKAKLMKETFELFLPPEQQSIAEKTHDALCESNEVKG